jgi:hypothetical protein
MEAEVADDKSDARGRLTPIDRGDLIRPWRRADDLKHCALYWMPVSAFPIPLEQRTWLLRFLDRLEEIATKQLSLRSEIFLQQKVFLQVRGTFMETAPEFSPMLGLGRKPHAKVPPLPTEDDIRQIRDGHKEFNFDKLTPDYCYWFVQKSGKRQRELFGGQGGLIMIFLKPDPKALAPVLPISARMQEKYKMFQLVDVNKIFAGAFSLKDAFLQESKKLFGAGLENEPQFPGLLFILPLLNSASFFAASGEEVGNWFRLFDLYICESPIDKGVLIASRTDLDEHVISIVEQLRKEGFEYREH